jgi:hypothetical protein
VSCCVHGWHALIPSSSDEWSDHVGPTSPDHAIVTQETHETIGDKRPTQPRSRSVSLWVGDQKLRMSNAQQFQLVKSRFRHGAKDQLTASLRGRTMPPMARLPKLLWLTGLSVVLASAVLPGCGDDDGGDDETGGKGGASTGGKGGATTGGKGGSTTGGKGGATTGGVTQGGEAGAPVTTGGTSPTGGAGGEVSAGAGAGGAPVTGGSGGVPEVGGGGAGGVPDEVGGGGVGGSGEGGSGGEETLGGSGGVGGSEEVGGAGGEGGSAAVGQLCEDQSVGQGFGKSCSDYCEAFFDDCDAYNDANDTFDNEADCLAECAGYTNPQLCCRVDNALAASVDVAYCNRAAGDEVCQ